MESESSRDVKEQKLEEFARKLEDDAAKLEAEKAQLEEEKARVRRLEARLEARLEEQSRPKSKLTDVVQRIIKDITWPSKKELTLRPLEYSEDNIHRSKCIKSSFVGHPLEPKTPCMLLYRLGESQGTVKPRTKKKASTVEDKSEESSTTFIEGGRLEDFPAINNPSKCTILLAPSGAGKTRKLYELLYTNSGFFIPYKQASDKNDGSLALWDVMQKLEQDPMGEWSVSKPSADLYETRRKRAYFAIQCVLIAFCEIYKHARLKIPSRRSQLTAFEWLLIQLFPGKYLQRDWFQILAERIYDECSPEECGNYQGPSDLFCVLDEAQALGGLLPDKFFSSMPSEQRSRRNSLGLRPLLSPVLHGIQKCLGRYPIISGTGLSLMREFSSLTSAMGTIDDCVFQDFPSLAASKVEDLLKKFLIVQDEFWQLAVEWLVGRPRFVNSFIEQAIKGNLRIQECLDQYLNRMIETGTGETPARTPRDGFKQLQEERNEISIFGQMKMNPYRAALMDCFFLSMGWEITPHESPALIEVMLGYVVKDCPSQTIIRPEPLILATAGKLVAADASIQTEMIRAISDSLSHMGERLELLAARPLLEHLTSKPFSELFDIPGRNHPFTALGKLDPIFSEHYLCGQCGANVKGVEFYDAIVSRCFLLPNILFPDNNAGPDVVLRLEDPKSHRKVIVFVQVKMAGTSTEVEALNTVNPSKFYHVNRGKPQGLNPGQEHVMQGYAQEQSKFVATEDKPLMVRMLFSSIKEVNTRVEIVKGCGQDDDLLIVLGPDEVRKIIGDDLMGCIRKCRDIN